MRVILFFFLDCLLLIYKCIMKQKYLYNKMKLGHKQRVKLLTYNVYDEIVLT